MKVKISTNDIVICELHARMVRKVCEALLPTKILDTSNRISKSSQLYGTFIRQVVIDPAITEHNFFPTR